MRKIREKLGREARERFEGRRGRIRAGRRNRRSDGRVPLAKAKQKFSLSQFARRVFTPTISTLGLGNNESISFHVHGPSDIEA